MALTVASGLALGAGVLGAIGATSEGDAAADAARAQAKLQEEQAALAREFAKVEAEDFRRRQHAFLSERRAAMGASGVEIGTGSPLLAIGDFAAETELQARRIAAGGKLQATRLEQEASLLRSAGSSAESRGLFRAGASLLSGIGQAFG